jgi:uridylate kinase
MNTVISLGGSIVAPDTADGAFLKDFTTLIEELLVRDAKRRFIIVTGGGAPARLWQKAYREVRGGAATADAADWIGIAATRLNAELLRAAFDRWHPAPVITNPSAVRRPRGRIMIGAGWKPGFSSDYDAALLASRFNAPYLLNLSNIAQVYTADPNVDRTARPLEQISWPDFRAIVGNEWMPGKNVPFDPVASALAEKAGLKVICAAGRDIANTRKILNGEPFFGTTIG